MNYPQSLPNRASLVDPYGFDTPLDRTAISTMKWEAEVERKADPGILCFGTAEMDFPAAPPIRAALQRIVASGHFGYPYKTPTYVNATIGFFDRRFGWRVDPDWIASSVGIYPAMQPIIEELTEPGDEIIYQTPVHHVFEEVITSAGRVAVPNPLTKGAAGYEMDFEGLARCVTDRAKLLLLCSPHNPVGRVWTRAELQRLSDFCLERGIIVVTDKVYCGLILGGVQFTPFASLSQAASQNSITLVSASKCFNTTGLKHSLVITENAALRAAYLRGLRRSNLNFGSSIFGMAATEAAFRDCDGWTAALISYIEGNFALLQDTLARRLPQITLTLPEATYFAWLDCTALGLSADALRRFFEDEACVILTYGDALGPGGEGHVRFNLATTRDNVRAGIDRICSAWHARQTTSN